MQSTIQIKVKPTTEKSGPWGRYVNNFSFVENRISKKLIALLSFSLSLSIIIFDPVINSDGVLYLFTAETFISSGFSAALQAYPWPFFSVFIAAVNQLTPLSLLQSSHVIVSLSFFVASYAFVRLVSEMGGSKTAQLFALIIILFHPLLADYRSSSVRDPGMWGFMLLSLLEMMRYSKNPTLAHQIKWLSYIGIAFLFRVEVFVIALISPMALLFIDKNDFPKRVINALRFISIPVILVSTVALILLVLSPEKIENFKLLKDLNYYTHFFSQLSNTLESKSLLLSQELLVHTAKDDSYYAIISVFFTVFALNIIRALTPVYLLLLVGHYLSKYRLRLNANSVTVIATYISILSVYLFLFTISRQFNLERYSFQLVLILLLFLPFIFENLWNTKKHPVISRSVVILLLSLYALDTIINSDYKKSYIDDAAIWLQQEKGNSKIISNHHHIAFFSDKLNHRVENLYYEREKRTRLWKSGITYAYHAKRKMEAPLRKRIEKAKAKIIKEFGGNDTGVVIIFTLPKIDVASE